MRLSPLVLGAALVAGSLGLSTIAGRAQTGQENAGATIRYSLGEPEYVTIAIDSATGKRVRNLISCAGREKGAHQETWDGLDDAGRPVPAGSYRWKGLVHGEIASYYIGSFNSPGNPPWITNTRNDWNLRWGTAGGWLSDHAAPKAVFADDKHIYVGAPIAEAGHSLIEVTPDGRKDWGALWFSASGADAVATYDGIIYVAGEKGWIGDRLMIHRLNQATHQFLQSPIYHSNAAFIEEKSASYSGIQGMVVTARSIVLSLSDHNRLTLFDRSTSAFQDNIPLPNAGPITESPEGAIYAVSGSSIVRVDLDRRVLTPVVADGIGKAGGLAVDTNGESYVSDDTPGEMCVKVFSKNGVLVRRIGKRGGRKEGAFDPYAMSNPAGVAIDSNGRVWVAENDFLPKRLGVWSKDGKPLWDYVGPCSYGGGGSLDPNDPSRAFYSGMEFRVDYSGAKSAITAVLYRPQDHTDLPAPIPGSGSHHCFSKAVRRDGKLYLVADTGYGGGAARGSIAIGEVVGDHLAPRAILGPVSLLRSAWSRTHPDAVARLCPASMGDNALFLWTDTNGNAKAEPDEVSVKRGLSMSADWSVQAAPDLSLCCHSKETAIRIPPNPGTQLGYDFKNMVATPLPDIAKRHGMVAVAGCADGSFIINVGGCGGQGDWTNVLLGLGRNGDEPWTYPNPYPDNTHNSPRPTVGQIQHTLNIEGIAHAGGAIGDLFQLNGNKGLRYIFTGDGMFVSQLYADTRLAPSEQSLPSTELAPGKPRGVRMDKISLCDECFHGWFGRSADGRYLQVIGKDSNSVAEVTGLETLKRLRGGEVALAHEASAADRAEAALAAPVSAIVDPPFAWWNGGPRYDIPPTQPVASFAIAATPGALMLHVAVPSGHFVNDGDDVARLFKTGDAVDFRFAADPTLPAGRTKPAPGDLRLLFAQYKGKPVAVLYRFSVPGAALPVKFASPTGETTVDEVKVLTDVNIDVKPSGRGYTLLARIPWRDLGLSRQADGAYRGDVGIIVGEPNGSRARARYYHFDQGSGVVVDLSSEAQVFPNRWGILTF